MADPNMIYKITVLRMLYKVDFPLSNTQVTDFFLDMNYTDYFTIQQIIGALQDTGMIEAISSHNSTQYTLTDAGKKTLELFKDKITPGIENDIIAYFSKHSLAMKTENSIIANYYKDTKGGYLVECQTKQDGITLISISMHASTKEQAEAICYNWKVRYEDVYMELFDILIQ